MCASTAQSSHTVIKGNIKGGEGKYIRFYAYDDYLTFTEKKIGQSKINDKGAFEVRFNIPHPVLIYMRVDFFQGTIYVERGQTYQLQFNDFDPFSYRETGNPFLERPLLNYDITNRDSTDLNFLVIDFERRYNSFIAGNMIALFRGRNKALLDSFSMAIDAHFATFNNDYFDIYKTYKIALLEQSSQVKSRERLFADYIYDKPIHTGNIGYMQFFNQYFTKFFTNMSQNIRFSDLEHTINDLASYPALLDSLGKDSLLRNELIRNLVLVKGLGEIWEYPGFIKDNIITLLEKVAKETRFPEVRRKALNQKEILNRRHRQFPAKQFRLTDVNNRDVTLNNLKGKYVFLFFWNTSCARCIAEMEILNDIHEKFKNRVEIIGVSIDMEPLNLNYFLQSRDYTFTIAHFNHDYEILDNYKVRNLPFFLIIGPDGQVVRYPAPNPSNGLEVVFSLLTRGSR